MVKLINNKFQIKPTLKIKMISVLVAFLATIIFYGCSSNGTSGTQSNNAFTKKNCKSAHYENMQSYP